MGESARILRMRGPNTHEQHPITGIVRGNPVFARETSLQIDERDFISEPLIGKFSNGSRSSYTVRNRQPYGKVDKIVIPARPTTLLNSVVVCVFDKTHADLDEETFLTGREYIIDEYPKYSADKAIQKSSYGKEIDISVENYLDSDLLRGMRAFNVAAFDRHNSTYDGTILEPAMQFAKWLIAIEQTPDLQ